MDAIEQFRLFFERVEELRETRIVKSGALQVSLTVQWSAADGLVKTTLRRPDEEDFKSFLVTIRHFLSEREPVFVDRMFNLLNQQIIDDEIRGQVAKARAHWKKCIKGGGLRATFDEVEMTPEHIADVVINGHYFHSDPKYRKELKNMLPYGRDITDALFIDFLVNATEIINYLGNVVSHCLREGLFKDAATATS